MTILNKKMILTWYEVNNKMPHTSIYHHEDYYQHCMLVIGEALKSSAPMQVKLAACLHDIAKPRTAGINKKGGACFYNHEQITKEELAMFLNRNYHDFDYVYELIRAHMLPYQSGSTTPEKFRDAANKKLSDLKDQFGPDFITDLMMLYHFDDQGSVRTAEDMVSVDTKVSEALLMFEKFKD